MLYTPRHPTNTSSVTTTPLDSVDHNKASISRYSCRFPKNFFARHTEDTLTDHLLPGSLLKYVIPSDNDKPQPQLCERLPDAALDTPHQPVTAEQGDSLPPAEALAPAKVEEIPEDETKLASALKSFPQGIPNLSGRWPTFSSPLLLAARKIDTER